MNAASLKKFCHTWSDELRRARELHRLPLDEIKGARSIAQLQEAVAGHTLHGFNGQWLRAAYLIWLYETLGCTRFLETGTRWGYTAITARLAFGGPVHSVELIRSNHWHAKAMAWLTFKSLKGLHLEHNDSRAALQTWLAAKPPQDRPMIYLDAHFYEDHPLVREMELAVKAGNCAVVIDDFKVPHDSGFGWDTKKGFEVCIESIANVIPRERSQVLFPSYSSDVETGFKRGACIILIDLTLPSGDGGPFPKSLFQVYSK